MSSIRRKIHSINSPLAKSILLLLVLILVTFQASGAEANCKDAIFDPITDICWDCMWPARIGANVFGTGSESTPGLTDPPACVCPSTTGVTVGVSVAFWEQSRMVETVKDAYCFPSMGASMMGSNASALLSGSQRSEAASDETNYASQQVHYYILPVWQLMDLFTDFPCVEKKPYDLASITEVDPTWNDDLLSFILSPESMLFSNMITQISCAADSVAANIGDPLDPEFYCLGSWGSTYPLSGSTIESNPLSYNAQLASRMVFKMGREGLLFDTAVNQCATDGVLSPIMVKSHYRLQVAKPQRGNSCVPIGRSSFIWGAGKNPPFGTASNAPDNFLWILLRARTCCVGYNIN